MNKITPAVEEKDHRLGRLAAPFMEIFGLSRSLAILMVLLCGALIASAIYYFFHSAPPHKITITAGGPGSPFALYAERYRTNLESNGITLNILSSQGSQENLKRLGDSDFKVDIGFVQGGVTNGLADRKLVSLGSVNYEPLLVFYRSASPVKLLSGFAGKRVAIGSPGSGTHSLALELFHLNGIEPGGATSLLDLDSDAAVKALLAGEVDAVFLMGDTTSTGVMKQLEHDTNFQLFDFTQADGYSRRISYVSKLVLPQGSLDFGKNIPSHDVNLIGPTVELLVRSTLHPALQDVLIEAAKNVHKTPGLFKRQGEFPTPIEHDFPVSPEALRYYKSGKGFLYGLLPFWLASFVYRIVVVILPLIVVLVPAVKMVPAVFKWRMQMRINRWYRELLTLERGLPGDVTPAKREKVGKELARIEKEVYKMKVTTSFASQFYDLRGNILFVQNQLAKQAVQ